MKEPIHPEGREVNPLAQLQKRWSESIQQELAPALGWGTTDNTFLTGLQTRAREADAKLTQLVTPVGIPGSVADLHLSRLSEDDLTAEFAETILKIGSETGYLKQLQELGLETSLISGLRGGRYAAPVIFIQPDNIANRVFELIVNTEFDGYAVGKLVLLKSGDIHRKLFWKLLATDGTLPEELGALQHELVHTTQLKVTPTGIIKETAYLLKHLSPFFLTFLVQRQLGDIISTAYIIMLIYYRQLRHKRVMTTRDSHILGELHAYDAGYELPLQTAETTESDEIINHLSLHYGLRPEDMEVARTTLSHLRTLRALGLSHHEIGRIVARKKYDPQLRSFRLDIEIKAELKKRGITESMGVDPDAVCQVATTLFELDLAYNRHEATRIAAKRLSQF